ncbi:MAG: hypothetical protein ACFFDP_08260 [Promethearchaeota archaeon]
MGGHDYAHALPRMQKPNRLPGIHQTGSSFQWRRKETAKLMEGFTSDLPIHHGPAVTSGIDTYLMQSTQSGL